MEKLSVIIITYNEEENIRDCLESVRWADEIIVVDAFSTDRTVEICREYTDKIFLRKWRNFSDQKNFALSKATHEWVLSIDADERVSPWLQQEIQSAISPAKAGFRFTQQSLQSAITGYYIPRKNYFLGKWIKHCGWWPDYQPRLFKRTRAIFPARMVHERVKITGKCGRLRGWLEHYTYRTLSEYIRKLERFTTLLAQQMANRGQKVHWYHLVLRPPGKFLETYILKRGILDGKRGLMVCCLSAVYTFMKYAKLWELSKSNV